MNFYRIYKPNVAFRYMKQALENEISSGQPKSHISSTKLNICAILSQLGKHNEAIGFVLSAIQDLQLTLEIVKVKLIKDEEEKKQAMMDKGLLE